MGYEVTFRVLAIDPGKMSGIVVLKCSDDLSQVDIELSVEYDEAYTGFKIEEVTSMANVEVVMEDFFINVETGKKKDVRYSLELIGVGRHYANSRGRKFKLQPPSSKQFAPNDMLRDLGFWVPGGEGHMHDAMRHAIVYLVQEYGWRPKGLLGED